MFKEGKDYQLISHHKIKDHASVKIIAGDYDGVVYTYGKVSFELKEVKGETYPTLSFIYEISICPDSLEKEDLEKDPNFKTLLGEILNNIIQDHQLND